MQLKLRRMQQKRFSKIFPGKIEYVTRIKSIQLSAHCHPFLLLFNEFLLQVGASTTISRQEVTCLDGLRCWGYYVALDVLILLS